MGAKLTADFTEKGLLTQKAGNLLLICCNQLSPAFVGSYVMIQCLNSPDLIPVSYLLLYLPPAIPVVILLARTALAKDNPSPAAADRITTKKGIQISNFISNHRCQYTQWIRNHRQAGRISDFLRHSLPVSGKSASSVPDCQWLRQMLMEVTSGIHYFSGSARPFSQNIFCA